MFSENRHHRLGLTNSRQTFIQTLTIVFAALGLSWNRTCGSSLESVLLSDDENQ